MPDRRSHEPDNDPLTDPSRDDGEDARPDPLADVAPALPHPAAAFSPREVVDRLRRAVDACRACDLWERATQGVWGEGPRTAAIMLVGEQPGDREDLVGRPFVGPAGAMLDQALEQAGIDRGSVYVTNAVKHFKWRPSGKKRLHERPNTGQIRACRPWLELELSGVAPTVVVAMGAVAAQSLLGDAFRITKERGRLIEPVGDGPVTIATFHPSAILRAPDRTARDEMYAALVGDLRLAAEAVSRRARRAGRLPRTA
jgi:DNA polymerase